MDENDLDFPNLREEDLNGQQKEIYFDLVEYRGYSRFLVLRALEECPATASKYDIQDWCDENKPTKSPEAVPLDSSTSASSSEPESSPIALDWSPISSHSSQSLSEEWPLPLLVKQSDLISKL